MLLALGLGLGLRLDHSFTLFLEFGELGDLGSLGGVVDFVLLALGLLVLVLEARRLVANSLTGDNQRR